MVGQRISRKRNVRRLMSEASAITPQLHHKNHFALEQGFLQSLGRSGEHPGATPESSLWEPLSARAPWP